MSDDSEIVKAVAQGTVEGAFAPFGKLITNLLGPVSEEMGYSLRDRFLAYRTSRTKRLLGRVQEIFEERQIEPHSVPPKLLSAVMENGSLEEDDSLQDRWAALLVNATGTQFGWELLTTSAPEILKQLNKWEAMLLERCCAALTMEEISPLPNPETLGQHDAIYKWEIDLRFNHGFDRSGMQYSTDFATMKENLVRLGLLRRKEEGGKTVDLVLTLLGYHFIILCHSPRPESGQPDSHCDESAKGH
jgi:hypothetical protein